MLSTLEIRNLYCSYFCLSVSAARNLDNSFLDSLYFGYEYTGTGRVVFSSGVVVGFIPQETHYFGVTLFRELGLVHL